MSEAEENKQSESQSSTLTTALSRLATLLSAYLAEQHACDDAELDRIVDGFVLLESPLSTLAAAQATAILADLRKLRARAHLLRRSKTFVRVLADRAIDEVVSDPESDAEVELRAIDASKRHKIVTDVVSGLAPQWLNVLRDNVFDNQAAFEEFASEFSKEEYAKNTVGALIDTVTQASHAAEIDGLTRRVLSDMAFALIRTLYNELRRYVQKGLKDEDVDVIHEHMLCVFVDEIVRLWRLTAKVSLGGTERQGRAVKSILAEEKEEKERLRAIKERGNVDAKFEDREKPGEINIDSRVAEFSSLVESIAQQLGTSVNPKASGSAIGSGERSKSQRKERKPSELSPHDLLLSQIRASSSTKRSSEKASSTNMAHDEQNTKSSGGSEEFTGEFRTKVFASPVIQENYA